jgi:hypothetical protein
MFTDARKRRNRDEDEDGDDDDEIVADGGSVRVRLDLCDGTALQRSVGAHAARHRSTDPASLRDARRMATDARNEMITQQRDAWKSPSHPTVELPPPRPSNLRDARRMATDAYWSMVKRNEQAWRNPPNPNSNFEPPSKSKLRDAAEPDMGTRPGDMPFHRVSPQEFLSAYNRSGGSWMQPPRPGDLVELRRRADASYEERNRLQREAWRNPTSAANAVERQAEQWRHGR